MDAHVQMCWFSVFVFNGECLFKGCLISHCFGFQLPLALLMNWSVPTDNRATSMVFGHWLSYCSNWWWVRAISLFIFVIRGIANNTVLHFQVVSDFCDRNETLTLRGEFDWGIEKKTKKKTQEMEESSLFRMKIRVCDHKYDPWSLGACISCILWSVVLWPTLSYQYPT